jgi:hypothetical protein
LCWRTDFVIDAADIPKTASRKGRGFFVIACLAMPPLTKQQLKFIFVHFDY